MTESDRIEYKLELTPDVDLEAEAVAFLNKCEGGVLYFGIDKHGVAVGVKDVDADMLRINYQEKGSTLNDGFARTLELLTDAGEYNYAAYLLADENANSVKVAKYAGEDRLDLIESNEYGMTSVVTATKRVIERLKVENTVRTRKTALERIDSPLWDEKAIREAVVNAIVHNDYTREVPPKIELFANRLEITSYGRLPEGLSRDDFFSGVSVPRNKELMRVFRDLELVESLGSGMTYIMKKYGRDNFQFLDNFIRISIPYNPDLEHETINGGINGAINGGINGGINGAIKKAIVDNAGIDVARLVAVLGKSRRTIERAIARLKQQGVIEYRGSKKTGGYYAKG